MIHTNKMINYSVIIPHKDIPHLLQRCLDSIPRREDVQIIVVDDNSDPAVVDFAHFPGLNDPHIEIIFGKNENGRKGAGYARNLGMKRALGKWLVFADADDFFMPCISEAFDKYKDDENDIIYFYPTSADSETLEPACRHLWITDWLDKIQKTNNRDWEYKLFYPWAKFIKREITEKNGIRFKEIMYANDVFFSYLCAVFTSKKTFARDVIYCITQRNNSLIEQKTVEALTMRFYEESSVVILRRKAHKKKDYKDNFYAYWWDDIYKVNKRAALLLLPRLIKTNGWVFALKILPEKNFLGLRKPYRLCKRILKYVFHIKLQRQQ